MTTLKPTGFTDDSDERNFTNSGGRIIHYTVIIDCRYLHWLKFVTL